MMRARHRVSNQSADRRHFIGGSDARIITGDDAAALLLPTERCSQIKSDSLFPFRNQCRRMGLLLLRL